MLTELLYYATSLTTTDLLITILFVLLSFYTWSCFNAPRDLPPGPPQLPILGYLPLLKGKLHVQFRDLSLKYGEIISLRMGKRIVIVLNSYESIKEAFVKQKEIFAARPFVSYSEVKTIFHSEGETFREHKRFILATLKEFGFGKHSLEPRIKDEIYQMLEELSKLNEKPADIGKLLRMSVSNVICALLNGKRYDYKDETFQKLIHLLSILISRATVVTPATFFPWFRKIPFYFYVKNWFYEPIEKTAEILLDEIRKQIKEKKAIHQPGQKDNFINAWFTEADERKKTNNDQFFTDEHLTFVVQSLFAAGTDTTANSLRWALMYLMTHPAVQSQLHKEIDDVVGFERMPSLEDRDQMPRVEATILEIQRISSLVPLAIFHSNSEETKLRNYTIPKRSVVFPNLWAVHHDPVIYPEPDKFLPFSRFLDDNGQLVKSEKLIPFSLGKRQCLGKSLAEMELFLYFTSMLQRFEFKLPHDETLSFDYVTAAVATPKPFRIIAVERKGYSL